MATSHKYRPEFCEELLEHMGKGFSFESFGAVAKVTNKTLHDWAIRYPEFGDAKAHAELLSLWFWEKMGMAGASGKIKGFQTAVWIFSMKCRFRKYGWRDDEPEEGKSNKDTAEQAKRLLEVITEAVKDKQCQTSQSQSAAAPSEPPSQSGLLGA